jgi:hypothetical protein
MALRFQTYFLQFIRRAKYARRFIKNDGLIEYFYFASNRPRFYEEFEPIIDRNEYPSNSFQSLQVPSELKITKWVHYFGIYDQYLRKYCSQRSLKVLEIGVAGGGSLKLWRDYFGADSTIFGIDIDAKCSTVANTGCEVRIGSQVDKDFLIAVLAEMGGVDVVIDDGSHLNSHVIETFSILFPLLNSGGTYLIEDTSTSYWPGIYKGGLRRKGTSIEFFKNIVDLPNRFFFSRKPKKEFRFNDVESVHFHPSVIVVEKMQTRDIKIWRNYN